MPPTPRPCTATGRPPGPGKGPGTPWGIDHTTIRRSGDPTIASTDDHRARSRATVSYEQTRMEDG